MICVKVYDADSLDIDKLEYFILFGNDYKNFVIDSEIGIIIFLNLRRYILKLFYSFNIFVFDGVFRSLV